MSRSSQPDLLGELREAVSWSEWYEDGGERWLAEQWRLRADELRRKCLGSPEAFPFLGVPARE